MGKNAELSLVTPKFRMSWPSLLTPVKDQKGNMKYQLVMVFDPATDMAALKKAAHAAAVAKWGDKIPTGLKSPFRSGDEESFAKYPEMKGKIIIRASSNTPPGIVDHKVQPVMDQKEIYGGRWAIAAVTASAYDQQGNRGVAFYVNHVQLLDHDTPFGGRTRAEDVFQPTAVQGTSAKAMPDDGIFG